MMTKKLNSEINALINIISDSEQSHFTVFLWSLLILGAGEAVVLGGFCPNSSEMTRVCILTLLQSTQLY